MKMVSDQEVASGDTICLKNASDCRVPQMCEIGMRVIASLCKQADDKTDAVFCDRLLKMVSS
jgi:hypothetical protein